MLSIHLHCQVWTLFVRIVIQLESPSDCLLMVMYPHPETLGWPAR